MTPSAEALAAHTFQYDVSTLDKTVASFLQTFYTFSDDFPGASGWSACFTENAVFKKNASTVTGRDAIHEANLRSWEGMKSRLHIVYQVYPYSTGATKEVMVHGKSEYVYEDGSTGEMGWAARLCFTWSLDGQVLINFYQVFPGIIQKT